MKELPMFTYYLGMGCLHPDTSCQLLCPVINLAMSNNFKHSHVHFTQLFSVIKLDLVIQALLLDYILALEKKYAYASRASSIFFRYGKKILYVITRQGRQTRQNSGGGVAEVAKLVPLSAIIWVNV